MASRPQRTHPAVRGFDRAAETYERGRPDYPVAAVDWLGRVLRLGHGTTVVELGSGTGKLTRLLARTRAARIAIEPTAGMRRVFERTVPEVPVLDGTAETIPLPEGFADAVLAAQAFHWFSPRRALPEIARVLRPHGGLGLVWNLRDDTVDWSRRLTEIVDSYREAHRIPRTRDHAWRPAFERSDSPFGPLRSRVFSHVQRAPRDVFVSRILSVSVIAVLPAAERRTVADRVRAVLQSDPSTRGRRVVELPYRTEVYWTHRA
ncbi:MAG TPA: class I SAM-dependent methyltransferase [Thermoplasmata archaeon]|nr:class I SAM-dependent methyltransferase [Thermoplasmata archaeon]